MGFFGFFKKKKELPDFSYVTSIEKAKEECSKGILEKMYVISPIFGGSENEDNIVYVPHGINNVKEGYDNLMVNMIKMGSKVSYNCKFEYKNNSVVPSKVLLISSIDGKEAVTHTVNVW